MSNNILFIFEGKKTEQNIAQNLVENAIREPNKTIFRASYGHNIYVLYKQIKDDDALDLFELVRKTIDDRGVESEHEQKLLDLPDRDSITDIYLFFDYDSHTTNANDGKLAEMLALFNNSQEHGSLFISYPMVEAIRHIQLPLTGEQLYSSAKAKLLNYKNFLKEKDKQGQLKHIDERYLNWGLYDTEIWSEIIWVNLSRANYLVNQLFDVAKTPLLQQDVFQAQLTYHAPNQMMAILSAFPLMLYEYYGGAWGQSVSDDSPHAKN